MGVRPWCDLADRLSPAAQREDAGPGARQSASGSPFRYRLHSLDGDDLGEATYAMMIKPGEEILLGAGRRFRVLDVVPFEEEDESPLVGMLKVQAA